MSSSGDGARILFFLPERGTGGAEKIFSDLVAGFRPERAEVLLAADPTILEQIRSKGGRGFRYLPWPAAGSLDRPLGILRHSWELRRILREHAVTHCFAMKYYGALVAAIAVRLLRRPPRLIASLRGPAHQHIVSMVSRPLTRLYLRVLVWLAAAGADRIVVPGAGIKEDLVAHFRVRPDKVTVIYNGLDSAAVERLSRETAPGVEPEPGCQYLLSLGRLSAEKRVEWAIDAFALIAGQRPDCRLLVVGDGPERMRLEERAAAAGVADKILFVGHQANVYPYMRQAAVFIHTCEYEGLPNAVIEAMACGTPVVATDCPFGPRELLGSDERGLLVPRGDVPGLAAAVVALLADTGLRARLVGAAKAFAGTLDRDSMLARYRNLILDT